MLKSIIWRIHPLVAKLLPSGVRGWRTPDGIIYLDATESPMMLLRVFGRYESDKRQRLMEALGPGMVFVDVGANRGDFTMLASRAVGPGGRVIAIEPAPSNVESLYATVEANDAHNVTIVQAALWDEEGEGELHLAEVSGWHSLRPRRGVKGVGVTRVPLLSLDQLADQLGLERVDAVKIDVEGAEIQVLRGAGRVFVKHRPLVVMDVDEHGDAAEYVSLLTDLGYDVELPGGKELVAR